MKHHILAIGISKHKDSSANLAYAEKDAAEFFNLFKQNIGDIGYSRLLVDQEATLTEIKTALGKELKDSIKPEDAFFFFYSGHGALASDPNDLNTAINFLVPYDATHDIPNTCLSVDDIKKVFESLPSRANIIFIDSCFSGAIIKNGKSYPVPNTKSFKKIKSFTNTVVGNGSVIFTASKDDEPSIEDPEYHNGLFTHYVIEELQKSRAKESYSATEIFSPIVSGVSTRAKEKWHHIQTPTFLGKLEGDLMLPVFKKPLYIRPETIEIPKTLELQTATFSIPVIDLTNLEKTKLLQQTIDFVIGLSEGSASKIKEVSFERLCHKMVRKIETEWEATFAGAGRDVIKIPEAISKIEADSYQFMMLGAATSVYGSEKQMRIFSQHITSILDLTRNKSGLIALIAVPEVVVVEMIYIVGILSIANDNYRPLQILLQTKIDDPNYDMPPMSLLENNHIHYTRALTGYSDKVNDHIREFLKVQDWLIEFASVLENKTFDYQLQANFLLVMLTENIGESLWPDFARFYGQRIRPLIRKILYDIETREKIAQIMGIKENEVRRKFIEYIEKVKKRGLGSKYWWESITSAQLMTKEEREAAGIKTIF